MYINMINREIENKELIAHIHGSYVDYKMYMNLMFRRIIDYLDKHFPYKDEDNCFKSRYVDIYDIMYEENTSDFFIELSSMTMLSKKDIDKICDEFNMLLLEVKIITKLYHYSKYDSDLKDLIEKVDNEYKNRKFNYRFKRQRI